MSLTGLIPTDVSITAAILICAIAFMSGTARGFSGFGAALIFMPLASSMAGPRPVGALLPLLAFFPAPTVVSECVETCGTQGNRGHGAWRPGRRSLRNLLPQPARSGDDALDHLRLRVCAADAAAVGMALSGERPSCDFRRYRRLVRLLQRVGTDRRPADRRLFAPAGRRPPGCARPHVYVFFG